MSPRLPHALIEGLIDDAAVFPPGSSPLPDAVAAHLARTAYRRFVGPLLVPATAAEQVVALVGDAPLSAGLIARPGMPLEPVTAGVEACVGTPVMVTGIEVGAASAWDRLADLGAMTTEIPRAGFDAAMDSVAAAAEAGAAGERPTVQAKFRTGATDVWAWPDEDELARFVVGCVDRDLPFKLTGGLHHVLRAAQSDGQQHGLLNVLAAVDAAVSGASPATVADVLRERSAPPLAGVLVALGPDEVAAVRRTFTAYGCCTVTDPIGELVALGLLEREIA